MEKDQLNTINELIEMLKSATRKPRWKSYITQKKSFAKIIGLKNTFELWDIWRLRNPDIKRFTFQQNHRAGFIQHRLDICFKCFKRVYLENRCLRFVLQ